MQLRTLGSLEVPVIGMGLASSSGFYVGSKAQVQKCRQVLDNCLAQGCTFLDTSPIYRRVEGVTGQVISGRRDHL